MIAIFCYRGENPGVVGSRFESPHTPRPQLLSSLGQARVKLEDPRGELSRGG